MCNNGHYQQVWYVGGYSDGHKNLIILLRFIGNETWHNFIHPTIARRQVYREEDDIVESWCLNGCIDQRFTGGNI